MPKGEKCSIIHIQITHTRAYKNIISINKYNNKQIIYIYIYLPTNFCVYFCMLLKQRPWTFYLFLFDQDFKPENECNSIYFSISLSNNCLTAKASQFHFQVKFIGAWCWSNPCHRLFLYAVLLFLFAVICCSPVSTSRLFYPESTILFRNLQNTFL